MFDFSHLVLIGTCYFLNCTSLNGKYAPILHLIRNRLEVYNLDDTKLFLDLGFLFNITITFVC